MSDKKVVAFAGCTIPHVAGEPVPEIVELLETALEEARQGQLRGLAICKVIEDGTDAPILTETWNYVCKSTSMVWVVNRLHYRFNQAAFE